jgi:hypothetical protein
MKRFTVSSSKVAFAALVVLLGLALGTAGVQQAGAADAGTGSGERLVIAARRVTTQAVVPSLIGKDKAQTEKALAEAGLELGTVQFTTSAKGKPGTVVQQKPRAKSTVAKGSAVNVVVLLRAAATVSPKIVQRGEKVFMEFPDTVKDVTISDKKGNKLQQFNTGRRFEITESAVATKAGRITVKWKSSLPDKVYAPWPPPGGTAGDIDHTANFDSSHYINEDLLRKVSPLEQLAEPSQVDEGMVAALTPDTTTIENGEPANNDISGAVSVSSGIYSGQVVHDTDSYDYLKITAGPGGKGSLIWVEKYGGNVFLMLSNQQDQHITSTSSSRVWAAVPPNVTVYLMVMAGATLDPQNYTISISSKQFVDNNEPNDLWGEAKYITMQSAVSGLLTNVRGGAGLNLEVDVDFFKINLTQPQKIRIHVSNVGMPGIYKFGLGVYEPGSSPNSVAGVLGGDEATLDVDLPSMYTNNPFPSGYWRIKLSAPMMTHTSGAGYVPYECYRSPGYQLRVEEIP